MILALPLTAFLMFDAPKPMEPTNSPPIVFAIPQPNSGERPAPFEICFEVVKRVDIEFDDFERRPVVGISLTEEAGRRLDAMTAGNLGALAQVSVDGEVITTPYIQSELSSGSFALSGIDTIEQAERLRQAALGQCSAGKADTQ